jgi:hypothetical protein
MTLERASLSFEHTEDELEPLVTALSKNLEFPVKVRPFEDGDMTHFEIVRLKFGCSFETIGVIDYSHKPGSEVYVSVGEREYVAPVREALKPFWPEQLKVEYLRSIKTQEDIIHIVRSNPDS